MPQITIQDYSILNCFIFELRAATFLPLGLEHKKKEKNIICYFVLLLKKKRKNRIPTIRPIYLGSWVQKKNDAS